MRKTLQLFCEVDVLYMRAVVEEHYMTSIAWIERNAVEQVERAHHDNASIFTEIHSKLRHMLISPTLSSTHYVHSAGLTERIHSKLTEKVRPMLWNAKLKKLYWEAAAMHVAYIQNRTMNAVTDMKRE